MRRKGFLLAMVLLLLLIFVLLGMGFMTSRQNRYAGSVKSVIFAQAKSLAEAGMEDARVKLERDVAFPPPSSTDSPLFAYQENLFDPAGSGAILGYYSVTIDTTYAPSPYYIIRVTSIGTVGPSAGNPGGSCTLNAEYDIYPPGLATDPKRKGNPPPNYFRVINWTEEHE